MKASTRDVLQGYLDELLCLQEPETVPAPMSLTQDSARSVALEFQEPELPLSHLPNAQAREKLAKLLNSTPLVKAPVAESLLVESLVAESQALAPSVFEQHETTLQSEPDLLIQPEAEGVPTVAIEDPQLQQSNSETVSQVADPVELPNDDLQLGWLANGRPSWAQEQFDVLLFEVAGLTLAVPLIALGQIQPLTDELTPLFGQADWFMGLQPTPVGKIRTINTARFVMPERYQDSFVEGAKYVISIDGLPWGLAVDQVNQPITLTPEDVRWRGERSKRPWLAGTVKQHMCALLDIHTMGQMLQRADGDPSRRDPLADG